MILKNMEKYQKSRILLEHLDWNIKHLQEMLKNPKTVYYRDASIQRFGFTVSLTIKLFKIFLELNEQTSLNPKEIFQAASEGNFFQGIDGWESLISDYLQIKDGFKDDTGDAVYSHLSSHLVFFHSLYETFSNILHRKDPIQT